MNAGHFPAPTRLVSMFSNLTEAIKKSTQIQDHQKRVAEKLNQSGAVLVYHGMGSGKGLTSIYATQKDNPDVIVPASLRTNYQKEIDKHTTGGHKANVMSYEKAIKNEPSSKTLIMDEPQAIGHSDTDRSRILTKRGDQYERKLLMTGTPIRNHPSELAPLVNLLKGQKALPTDKKDFEERYVKEVYKKPGLLGKIVGREPQLIGYDIKNRAELERILKGHVDYYMPDKDNFPDREEEVIKVQMSKDQQKTYDYALQKLNNPVLAYKIRKGLPVSKAEAKNLNAFMSATRQISNTAKAYGRDATSPKISRAIEELQKKKLIDKNFRGMVYSNYLDSGLRTYKDELDKLGISNDIFDGSLSDKKREQMVNDYNSGKIKVLLVSGAGAQGLDLKGTKLVQILEPHWNTARTEQAKARAIRYKSHEHLPEDERKVTVQTFHSTLRPNMMTGVKNLWDNVSDPAGFIVRKVQGKSKPKEMSADEYLDKMNKDKDALNDKFLDVLRKVGSEHNDTPNYTGRRRKKEGLTGLFESVLDEYTKERDSKRKDMEEDIKAQRVRNTFSGGFAGGVISAVSGAQTLYGMGSAKKGALIGGLIGGGFGAYSGYKVDDYKIGKLKAQIKQMDITHGELSQVYRNLKSDLRREPTTNEIESAWKQYQIDKVNAKNEKQKQREMARALKKIERLKAEVE